jgi:hypothetical protein
MIVLFQGRCALRDQLSDALSERGLRVWAVEDNTDARNVLTREGWRARVLVVDHSFVSARKARWFIDKALDYSPSGWLVHLVEDIGAVTGLPGIVCRRDAPWAIVEVAEALAKTRGQR